MNIGSIYTCVLFRQVYDSIAWNKLRTVLEEFGIPQTFIYLIKECNTHIFCKVKIGNGISQNFRV